MTAPIMAADNTDHNAPVSGPANVRASDAERENALRGLSAHYAEGRLEPGEFDHRADAAMAARTREQLLALFADLPGPKPVPSPVDVQAPLRARPAVVWNAPLLLVPVLLAFAVLAALHGAPPFPLLAIAFFLARRHRRGHRWNREVRPWI